MPVSVDTGRDFVCFTEKTNQSPPVNRCFTVRAPADAGAPTGGGRSMLGRPSLHPPPIPPPLRGCPPCRPWGARVLVLAATPRHPRARGGLCRPPNPRPYGLRIAATPARRPKGRAGCAECPMLQSSPLGCWSGLPPLHQNASLW